MPEWRWSPPQFSFPSAPTQSSPTSARTRLIVIRHYIFIIATAIALLCRSIVAFFYAAILSSPFAFASFHVRHNPPHHLCNQTQPPSTTSLLPLHHHHPLPSSSSTISHHSSSSSTSTSATIPFCHDLRVTVPLLDHSSISAGNNSHDVVVVVVGCDAPRSLRDDDDDSRDYRRLLVQLEETERRFDDFWGSHLQRLRQCLELRLFEQDFRELQVN